MSGMSGAEAQKYGTSDGSLSRLLHSGCAQAEDTTMPAAMIHCSFIEVRRIG